MGGSIRFEYADGGMSWSEFEDTQREHRAAFQTELVAALVASYGSDELVQEQITSDMAARYDAVRGAVTIEQVASEVEAVVPLLVALSLYSQGRCSETDVANGRVDEHVFTSWATIASRIQ